MSRTVKHDFQEVLDYIANFKLEPLLKEKGYKEFISTYHKKYFGFYVLTVELSDVIPEEEYLFLKEVNSDLITCLFHLSTGNYKSARLLLRSSIECFLKSFTLSWLPRITTTRSVYDIIDKIKVLNYFSVDPFKSEFNRIHNTYKTLCKDVHSASIRNMANVNSLEFFPKYSEEKSKEITSIFLSLIPCYCFLLANKYNTTFHKIHHLNKEIILAIIEKQFRPVIMNTAE